MATDIFLKLGDIKGESVDERHRDEIDVSSWSWGLTHASSPTSSGHNTGRVAFQDFTFVHYLDKSSPSLMLACASGQHIPDGTLTERKAGAADQEFLVIKFSDVIVTSVIPSAMGGEGSVIEQVSLQAAKVDLEYKPQRPDGTLDAGIHFKFDIAANRVL